MPEDCPEGATMAIQDIAPRKLTYEDYLRFPDDGMRHEILDGEHYVTGAPSTRHQIASSNLHSLLGPWIRDHRLGRLFAAPCEVIFSRHNIAQPDLLFVSQGRAGIILEKNIEGAPDLIVEILSDSTRRSDDVVKHGTYERFGVLEYWLVDPKRRTVRVFRRSGVSFSPPVDLLADGDDVLATPVLQGLEIRVKEIFE
jgi:Uma2 family endonuclease